METTENTTTSIDRHAGTLTITTTSERVISWDAEDPTVAGWVLRHVGDDEATETPELNELLAMTELDNIDRQWLRDTQTHEVDALRERLDDEDDDTYRDRIADRIAELS